MMSKIDSGIGINLSTNAGGIGSGTGVLEAYDMPSNPTGIIGKPRKVTIQNNTGEPGYVFMCDNETDATALTRATLIIAPIEIAADETVVLTEDDFGDKIIATGINVAGSNAATGSGYEVTVNEVELF